MDKVSETRRALFEAWSVTVTTVANERRGDSYADFYVSVMWSAFNAALDAVEIELPDEGDISASDSPWDMQRDCRAAIESTGLGLRIK